MGRWIAKYCFAVAVPVVAVLALASVGARVTPLMCLLAAAAGVVVVALIDIAVNGRYMVAKGAQARRRRAKAQGED